MSNDGSYSKATTTNPKDLLGNKKVSITKLPMVAVIHGAHAMMNGADKYGPYNWRAKDVIASIYVDAALRHLIAWLEREEIAEDSGVHHLGHAIACCAILLDAQENGNLIDDRPNSKTPEVIKSVLTRLENAIQTRRLYANEKAPKPGAVIPTNDPIATARELYSKQAIVNARETLGYPTVANSGPAPCGEDIRGPLFDGKVFEGPIEGGVKQYSGK